ncbi:DUF481 domain-containing protein, partial [Candidatus Parabeggiatoa sp. HSG14]|uniref:DUF481 domain-containing protein n=1 Tax=Candidatus Parabeggiatoa sp. HSG14 TaxID=3055593 RepID=UPI0025A7DC3E|nr:DUF481 domain-containing protein [Thiotrichales bacterium HSG14]
QNSSFSQIVKNNVAKYSFLNSMSGKLAIGWAKDSGNVDKQNFHYGFQLKHTWDQNITVFKAKEKVDEKNDEKYEDKREISLSNNHNLTDISGIYGKVTSYKNIFQGYEHEWRLGTGYLHCFFQEDCFFQEGGDKYFKTRIGYQRKFSEYTIGEDENRNFLLLGYRGGYPLMKNISFQTELNYELDFSDSDRYEMDGFLSTVFHVNKTIDIKLNYKVDYIHIPVSGKKNTDTSITSSLVYKF